MANLLQLQQGKKAFGARELFRAASFSIDEEEHVGVIGPNGAGKSTLFKILIGAESLDQGQLVRSQQLRLGYLAQHDQWPAGQTVSDFLQDCIKPLWELKALGHKLGLTEEHFAKPMSSLSGGYRMRCKLLSLIGLEPNLMLLDEPTNYLDLETTLVLEKVLQGFRGAFLLISHDREFLRRTTDHILEIEEGEFTKFNGNLDDYFEQKALLRAQLEAQATSLKKRREEVLAFVSRFGAKASKARQAQSRLKTLAKMELIECKALPVKAQIQLPPPVTVGKQVLKMERALLGYPTKVVLQEVSFILKNGEHLAVVGLNGAGKSTLLKSLAGELPLLEGKRELGYQVSVGYFAQHVAEELPPNATVLEALQAFAHPTVSRQESLNMAGALLFSGSDVEKKISLLSGGEKTRVALGRILLQKAPCLILDEPTNHLDFQTVESLTQALSHFEGSLVVVSHDRGFVRRVATNILEVRQGRVELYPGSYDEYVWSLEKGALAERLFQESDPGDGGAEGALAVESKVNQRKAKKALELQLRKMDQEIQQLEKTLARLEEQIQKLNDQIATGETGPQADSRRLVGELSSLQAELTQTEERWLELQEQRAKLLT